MMTEVRRYTIMGSMGVAVRQGLNTPVLVSGTELILASDYDALAARVQEVERERDEWKARLEARWKQSDGKIEVELTKWDDLTKQLAEAQATIAVHEQCQQEIARAVGYAEGQKLTRHSFILKTIGQAEQQVARMREIITCLVKSADPNWYSVRNGYDWKDSVEQAETILRETGAYQEAKKTT